MKKNIFLSVVLVLVLLITLGLTNSFAGTVTLNVTDSGGNKLAGVKVYYNDYGNNYVLLGNTDDSNPVTATLPDGNTYKFKAVKDHTEQVISGTVPCTVDFQTSKFIVHVKNSEGSNFEGIKTQFNDYGNHWLTIGNTESDGKTWIELFPGTRKFKAYKDHTEDTDELTINDPGDEGTVEFQTSLAIGFVKDCDSDDPIEGIKVEFNDYGNHWLSLGTSDNEGKTYIELFEGDYTFRGVTNHTTQEKPISLFGTSTIVEFNPTKLCFSYSGTVKYNDYGNHWMTIICGTYLFPGIYLFMFNDGINPPVQESLEISGCYFEYPAAQTGTISGTVTVNGGGLPGVTVMLDGPSDVDPGLTDNHGQYNFDELDPGEYQVEIIEPLGYSSVENPKCTTLEAGGENTVNFELIQQVIVNDARSKGYWKHQFNVYVSGKGNAQESEADLYTYIDEVHEHYTIHFNIFDGLTTFEHWQDVLSVKGNAGMEAKAIEQLAALVLNFASLKIGQYQIVTADNRTAGDVLTYVSNLLTDGDPDNDELAKDLAEMVNEQHTIGTGIIPPGTILYKNGSRQFGINYGFAEIINAFAVHQNYPNPFNPSTTISYQLPENTEVRLTIYNMMGQKIRTLVNGSMKAGYYDVVWDGTNDQGQLVANGLYFYRIEAGTFTEMKRMIFLK